MGERFRAGKKRCDILLTTSNPILEIMRLILVFNKTHRFQGEAIQIWLKKITIIFNSYITLHKIVTSIRSIITLKKLEIKFSKTLK